MVPFLGCPKGWKLPDYTGEQSYENMLKDNYNIISMSSNPNDTIKWPLNFMKTGQYGSGFANSGRLMWGNWWTNANYYYEGDGIMAHYLSIGDTDIMTWTSDPHGYGYAIRCLVSKG